MALLRQVFGSVYSHCGGGPGDIPHDAKFYSQCMIGGVFACGLTHTAVVPLDIVKCRIQAQPDVYSGMIRTFRQMLAQEGSSWTTLGWLPTLIGYSMQGFAKFGFYEIFKDLYKSPFSEETFAKYNSLIYAAASASAEFIADIFLCPMESVKVRIQTSEVGTFPTTLGPAMAQIRAQEGVNGFFKGVKLLWGRQIPYTVMKFVVFEKTIQLIYDRYLQTTRAECGKAYNLFWTFVSGYIAGIVCAIVSHPADTIFTAMNKSKEPTTVAKVYEKIGFGGLWKGLGPRILMIGTLTGLQWWIYDSYKALVGLPASGNTGLPKK